MKNILAAKNINWKFVQGEFLCWLPSSLLVWNSFFWYEIATFTDMITHLKMNWKCGSMIHTFCSFMKCSKFNNKSNIFHWNYIENWMIEWITYIHFLLFFLLSRFQIQVFIQSSLVRLRKWVKKYEFIVQSLYCVLLLYSFSLTISTSAPILNFSFLYLNFLFCCM